MYNILYYSEGWGLGGIERFVMNIAPKLNPSQYRFDIFCVHDYDSSYDHELVQLGAHRYTVFHGYKPSLFTRYTVGPRSFKSLLLKQKYDIVHLNIMNGAGLIYAQIAKRLGVSKVIAHAHNIAFGDGNSFIKNFVHTYCKKAYLEYPDLKLACSDEAGQYLFNDNSYQVIHNPISLTDFYYSKERREMERKRLGVGRNTLLFGSVGRFSHEKNPLFQLKILNTLLNQGIDAKLLLLGSGPLYEEVVELSKQYPYRGRVILPAATTDVLGYYLALDVFTMPSLFEGLGITRLEAIATGLPCVISSNTPRLDFDDMTFRVEGFSPDTWASKIKEAANDYILRRNDGTDLIKQYKYDSDSIARAIEDLYR